MACYGPHPKHISHLDYLDLDRYYKKLSDYNNEPVPDPFVLHDAEYIDDVSRWPEILYGNIWEYLVQAACVDTLGQMQAFRSLKAHNFYQSGFVHTIFYHPVSNSSKCCILKGKLPHGQRHSDPPVNAWILVNKGDCQIKGHTLHMHGRNRRDL